MDRRAYLATVGTLSITGIAGCIGGGEGSPNEPEPGDHFQGVPNYDGFVDATDYETVKVLVGAGENGLRFEPPAITIAKRSTVVWEWTGKGGEHNVEAVEGHDWANPSGTIGEPGHTWSKQFKSTGTHLYRCWPHRSVMKGAIFVDPSATRGSGTRQPDTGDDGEGDSGDEFTADLQGWLRDTPNYEGVTDRTGESSVTVDVGAGQNGLFFDPPAVRVDDGTSVTWEWTGNGGEHSVESVETPGEGWSNSDGLLESGTHSWSREFTGEGTHLYECRHHTGVGMRGAIVVE